MRPRTVPNHKISASFRRNGIGIEVGIGITPAVADIAADVESGPDRTLKGFVAVIFVELRCRGLFLLIRG
jgi:hypothetical protein